MNDEPKITKASASIVNIWNDRLLCLIRKKWESEGTPLILPGGGIQNRETPILAAMREFCEETGIIIGKPHLELMDKFKTQWTDEIYFFRLIKPASPMMVGYNFIRPEFYEKFSGHIWINLKNKDLLKKLQPLCMHGLSQLMEKHWL